MKTTSDIAAFLKRNNGRWVTIGYDGKEFVVRYDDQRQSSAYLDDALENLAESLRRKANGMEPARESNAEHVPAPSSTTTTAKPYIPPFTQIPSISQAAQQAYQQQAASSPCATCGGAGFVNSTFFGPLPCGKCFGVGKVTP